MEKEEEGPNESPISEEEKFTVCIINKGGKRSDHKISVEQFSQGLGSSTKFVVRKVENEESTKVDNEVEFEIPPTESESLRRQTYKVRIRLGLTRTIENPPTCLADTGARSSLVHEDYLKSRETCYIKRLEQPKP